MHRHCPVYRVVLVSIGLTTECPSCQSNGALEHLVSKEYMFHAVSRAGEPEGQY